MVFQYFSVYMTYMCMYALLFLQLWYMIVLLIILIMAWWYHFWHIKCLKVSIYFILSSEINAYLQWIKVICSQVKWYCVNSQVSDTIYVFTVAKIWKFLAQMHFKRFGKWEASWKWCYGHWRVLTFLSMMSLIVRLIFFLQLTSGSLLLPTDFLTLRLLEIHSLKWYFPPLSRCKLCLHPKLTLLNTLDHAWTWVQFWSNICCKICWKYQHFHSCSLMKILIFQHIWWNIFGIHLKTVNIPYLLYGSQKNVFMFMAYRCTCRYISLYDI